MVECHLAKVDVEGSNPFSRSRKPCGFGSLGRVARRPSVPPRPAKTHSGTTNSSRNSSPRFASEIAGGHVCTMDIAVDTRIVRDLGYDGNDERF